MTRYRLTFTVIVLSVAFAAASVYYNKSRTNHNEGWKTDKELNKPFQESIITNGQKPAEFEIGLVKPSEDLYINNKKSIKIIAQIKFADNTAINSDIAPTSVTAHLRRGKMPIASKLLNPYAKKDLVYIYDGIIDVPEKYGDYRVEIEVNYSIYNDHTNEQVGKGMIILKPLNPFKKTLEGVTLHVGN